MSQTNGSTTCFEEEHKRQSKLTEKAFLLKLEKLQNERKGFVNKMKALIPEMKKLMSHKENIPQIKESLGTLNTLSENATTAHNEVLSLLPREEKAQQNEWFSSIMKYSDTFKNDIEKWLNESEPDISNEPDLFEIKENQLVSETKENNEHCLNGDENDDVKPSDSASNIGKHCSKSKCSASSNAHLNAEAELAALTTRQKLLEERHALEEEEERLRKRKEKLQLETEIAEKIATLNILKTRSTCSKSSMVSKTTSKFKATSQVSNGINSYLEKNKSKRSLNVHAEEFIPDVKQKTTNKNENYSLKYKTKMETAQHSNNKTEQNSTGPLHTVNSQLLNPTSNTITQLNEDNVDDDNEVLGIMKKQNEITTLLIQQQCLAALPKREIPLFDGDPLKYHTFIKAFENGVERNTNNNSDRLYFMEQYTKGHARELVRSCQHIHPDNGYKKAKDLLSDHFGNEQKVAAAYMDKALSWPNIKPEDVRALQDYSLFLRGCCNAMEDVQYLHDLDMPSNMLNIIRKLPYRLRDKLRSQACEIQERYKRRAKFIDIVDFIEKQVKVLTDPVFGSIQDPSTITTKVTAKPKSQPRLKGASFATTVGQVGQKPQSVRNEKDAKAPGSNTCLYCGAGHVLDMCKQLGKNGTREENKLPKGKWYLLQLFVYRTHEQALPEKDFL